jgi:hypothetical protein
MSRVVAMIERSCRTTRPAMSRPSAMETTATIVTAAKAATTTLGPNAMEKVPGECPPGTPPNGYFPIGAWAGLAVLAAYTAAALGTAAWLVRRRDAV